MMNAHVPITVQQLSTFRPPFIYTPFLQSLNRYINKHDCILSGPINAGINNNSEYCLLSWDVSSMRTIYCCPPNAQTACLAYSRCSIIFFVYYMNNEITNMESSLRLGPHTECQLSTKDGQK